MASAYTEETSVQQQATRYLSELYDMHKDALFSLAISILRNRADAEDVLQIVFQKVWRGQKNWKNILQWRAWLLQLTRHTCLDHLRQWGRIRKHEEMAAEDSHFMEPRSPVNSVDSSKVDQLHEVLRQLDEPCRSLILLKHLQELTFEEIGRVLQIPASTASTRYYEGMKRLQILWKEMENQEEKL